jgi:signal transduction histidine kinase
VALDELVESVAADDPSVRVEGEPVRVLGDRAALERALVNLVQNAELHGPSGGTVTVATVRRGDSAVLSVSDEGVGLDPVDGERAFERFWRSGNDESGSGLGLAIVRATAERHGGRAYAEGPRFTIELPALREFSESGATPRSEHSQKGSP